MDLIVTDCQRFTDITGVLPEVKISEGFEFELYDLIVNDLKESRSMQEISEKIVLASVSALSTLYSDKEVQKENIEQFIKGFSCLESKN